MRVNSPLKRPLTQRSKAARFEASRASAKTERYRDGGERGRAAGGEGGLHVVKIHPSVYSGSQQSFYGRDYVVSDGNVGSGKDVVVFKSELTLLDKRARETQCRVL